MRRHLAGIVRRRRRYTDFSGTQIGSNRQLGLAQAAIRGLPAGRHLQAEADDFAVGDITATLCGEQFVTDRTDGLGMRLAFQQGACEQCENEETAHDQNSRPVGNSN